MLPPDLLQGSVLILWHETEERRKIAFRALAKQFRKSATALIKRIVEVVEHNVHQTLASGYVESHSPARGPGAGEGLALAKMKWRGKAQPFRTILARTPNNASNM